MLTSIRNESLCMARNGSVSSRKECWREVLGFCVPVSLIRMVVDDLAPLAEEP
ncbi:MULTISPECIES: hypothetical protein [Haloarcula]|jgi:hypothetical protein|uniref:hypothetical protein n=1 Tax=Haloarcula TaxID=2237 RepID=UPI0013DF3199|nr:MULTISPECIES: hypothetical protein [Haloarcula]NHN63447.1 hypothetical protein [Haloarcula sp. JP-Z28]NHX41799.1 hypothetical protein [Haloarcula sp. R1-2]